MNPIEDDELIRLWRQSTSAQPDPEEIARLAGRASMRRFDRVIYRRNFVEYMAGLVGTVFFVWLIARGDKPYDRVQGLTGFLCFGPFLTYLWWHHRDLVPLDCTADARAYQAAMLVHIDKQIRLLRCVHYWVLPMFVWLLGSGLVYGMSALDVTLLAGLYIGLWWLNSSWAVRKLQAMRSQIEHLYEE